MRKNPTLLVLIALLCFNQLYSQTNVSGIIHQNTTWTKANSPYVLTGDVGIPSVYTLTVEPGVTISRTGNYKILINGAFIANGTQQDSIRLVSNSPYILSEYLLEFQKSMLTNSSLRFISVATSVTFPDAPSTEDATGVIGVGDESEFLQTSPKNSGVLKISRSYLGKGAYLTKGYQAAESLTIDSSTITGANFRGAYPRSEKIIITNCVVANSKLVSDSYNYGILFDKCLVYGSLMMANCCGANFAFTNSTVLSSEVSGMGVDGEAVVADNTLFLNTPISMVGSASLKLTNSKFITNRPVFFTSSHTQIANLITGGSAYMKNCEVADFSGHGYNGLYTNSTYSTNIVSNNSFHHLKDAVTVVQFSTANFNLSGNNFINISGYHICNKALRDFSAPGNYYDKKPGQTFYDIIFDNQHDLTYGAVNYAPYLTAPVSTAPISAPVNVYKAVKDNGVLVTWSRNKEPNLKHYKVYSGFASSIAYLHSTTVNLTDTSLFLAGANINDSIAVTALNDKANGTNDQLMGYESWYAPAIRKDATLAVDYTSFNGVYVNNTAVLTWQTANQANTSYFNIERSANGTLFTNIGRQSAYANNHTYTFTDASPAAGNNFYRIKEVDKNGQLTYSRVIKLNGTALQNAITLSPNPVVNFVKVLVPGGCKAITIINSLGQKIVQVNGTTGTEQYNINTTSLAAGVYRLVVERQLQQTETKIFIK